MATTTSKNYAAGHFDVSIDGSEITAYVKSVDGGMVKAASVEEPMGPYHIMNRHLATREIDPIQIEMGVAGAKWVFKALEDVIERRIHTRFSGQISHGDTNMKTQYQHDFERAILTEVVLPKLEAKSKDPAMVKVKLQPELVKFNLAEGPKFRALIQSKQKDWTCSHYLLQIDGIEEARFVTSIEPMTIKIGVKAHQVGGFKLPHYVPTKLTMPKLVVTVPMRHAKPFMDWYNASVNKEGSEAPPDADYEKTGSIEFRNQQHNKTLYTLDLSGLGPESVELVKSDANQNAGKMLKMTIYITKVKVVGSGEGLT